MIAFFKRGWFFLSNYRATGWQIFLLGVLSAVLFSLSAWFTYHINTSSRRIRRLEQEIFMLETQVRTLSLDLSSLTTVERVRAAADRSLPHYRVITRDDVLRRGRRGTN